MRITPKFVLLHTEAYLGKTCSTGVIAPSMYCKETNDTKSFADLRLALLHAVYCPGKASSTGPISALQTKQQ